MVLLYPPRPPSPVSTRGFSDWEAGRLAPLQAPRQAPFLDRLPSRRASDIKLPGLDPGPCVQGAPHFQEVMNLLGFSLGDRSCQPAPGEALRLQG